MRQFFLTKWDSLSYKLFQFLSQSSAVIFLQSEAGLSQVKLQAKYYKLRQNRENYYKERKFIPNWRNYYTKWEITLSVEFSFKLFTTASVLQKETIFLPQKGEMCDGKYLLDKNLIYFLVVFPFIFLPLAI